jgi:hypothetical protein
VTASPMNCGDGLTRSVAAASPPFPRRGGKPAASSLSPDGGAAGPMTPGGEVDGPRLAAGPRTWTLTLPEGTTIISGNNRLDRWTKNRLIKDLHALVADAVKRQMGRPVPPVGPVEITTEYASPPRLKRMRHPFASACILDNDNIAPTGKACADGIVKAGIWPSDSKKYVRKTSYILAPETHPRGLLRVHIAEVIEP